MGFRDDGEAVRFQIRGLRAELEELSAERAALRDRQREVRSSLKARAELRAGRPWSTAFGIAAGLSPIVLGLAFAMTDGGEGETLYGHVRAVSGDAPIAAGARCTLFVSKASSEDYDAKIDVLCAGRVVYGGGSLGFLECESDGSRFVRCSDPALSDDGGDPALELRRSERAVTIRDANPSWRLDIELTTPPSGTSLAPEGGAR